VAYYLDTTAHLERHGGEEGIRDLVESWLGDGTHVTSTHVEREWKRIVYGSASDVLNALPGARSLRDVRARLRQGFGREPVQRWLVYDMLMEDETCSLEELERRARRFLRTGFEAMFTDRVEARDGSRCGIAPRTSVQEPNGQARFPGTCQKDQSICDQIAFLNGNRAKSLAAADALQKSARPDHQALGDKAQQLMGLPERERKGSNCYGGKGLGGDISIAAECGPDEILLTTDHSFDVICPAMGVRQQRFDGTRMPSARPVAGQAQPKKRGRGKQHKHK